MAYKERHSCAMIDKAIKEYRDLHSFTALSAKKGVGGNTVPYKCYIIKQGAISCDTLKFLHKGKTKSLSTRTLITR